MSLPSPLAALAQAADTAAAAATIPPLDIFIAIAYLLAASLFIVGLKRLSSPATARSGNLLGALGMLLAVLATLLSREILTFTWILVGLVTGAAIGLLLARFVKMTAMPQMVGLLNGFGGAASALVAGDEYVRHVMTAGVSSTGFVLGTIMLSVIIGGVTFAGSMVAFAKLQDLMTTKPITFPLQRAVNALLFAGALFLAGLLVSGDSSLTLFAVLAGVALVMGVMLVIPIGGADMPVVVALLNSYSGIAAAMTGFVLFNNALIISGALVGASGLILTNIMCKAMNRSLANVMFGAFGAGDDAAVTALAEGRSVKEVTAEDLAILLSYARNVLIVPGYGMAVAQAQHQVRELTDLLVERGVNVEFAIHPVAGRMPGHMNVILSEAGVDYDALVTDVDQANSSADQADVAIVVGANDVVNPDALDNPTSPLYGMPIIETHRAQTVVINKRSMRPGFAGVENPLFYRDNARMYFGDAKKAFTALISEVKQVKV